MLATEKSVTKFFHFATELAIRILVAKLVSIVEGN